MKRWLTVFLLSFPFFLPAQTVVIDTSYETTVLECVSDYVDFADVIRYFNGLVVKQGAREYYLDSPYNIEVLGTRIVFDDPDKYTDRVTVYLNRTYYADMDEFKAAAAACISSGGPADTTVTAGIDSIAYFGDSLYVYAGGEVFTTYIDSCPCEEPPPPPDCVYVLGNPDTGEVVGDPSTGVVLFVASCNAVFTSAPAPAPSPSLKSGPPPAETMLAINCKDP